MSLIAKQTNHWQLKAANVTTDQQNHGYKIMIKNVFECIIMQNICSFAAERFVQNLKDQYLQIYGFNIKKCVY